MKSYYHSGGDGSKILIDAEKVDQAELRNIMPVYAGETLQGFRVTRAAKTADPEAVLPFVSPQSLQVNVLYRGEGPAELGELQHRMYALALGQLGFQCLNEEHLQTTLLPFLRPCCPELSKMKASTVRVLARTSTESSCDLDIDLLTESTKRRRKDEKTILSTELPVALRQVGAIVFYKYFDQHDLHNDVIVLCLCVRLLVNPQRVLLETCESCPRRRGLGFSVRACESSSWRRKLSGGSCPIVRTPSLHQRSGGMLQRLLR